MPKNNNSEYWEQRIANQTWKVYNSLEDKNRELLEFYTDASKDIKEELYTLAEKHSKDGVLSLSELHKRNRLTKLNEKYEQIAFNLGKQTEKTATSNMHDGFEEVYKNTGVGLGSEDFAMPNKKMMEKLLNEPWRGDSFSGRLWKNQKKLATGLNNTLLIGLQQGKTVTEITVNLHNFMGHAFNNCHRLVRTETMHYLNSATLQRYKDSRVEYVQVWCAQDERTCESCGPYHGKVYPIDKCPILPFHANCRCTIIPCFDEKLIQEHVDKRRKSSIIKADKENRGYSNLTLDNYKKLAHSVSKEERKILYGKGHSSGYINSSKAKDINGILRSKTGEMCLDDTEKEIVSTLSSAIRRNTIGKDINVTRYVNADALESLCGVKIPKSGLLNGKDFFAEYNTIPEHINKGNIYTEKGFLSTSGVIDKNVMQSKEIALNIKVPKESHCYVTTNYKESEIIFDRGTKLKILGARLKHDSGNERGIVLDCIIEGD